MKSKVVEIEHILTDDGGQILNRPIAGEPLGYLHVAGNLIPGLNLSTDHPPRIAGWLDEEGAA